MNTSRFPEILWDFRAETGSGSLSHSLELCGKAKSAAHVAGFDEK